MNFKELAQSRRSINYFDPLKDVDEQLLRKIISLASLSPSAYNLQPWSVIAVKSKEEKQKLYQLASKQQKILDAPITLIITADREGFDAHNSVWQEVSEKLGDEKTSKIIAANKKLYGATEERKIKFGEINAGLLAMSIMYAAKHYSVDSHPVGGIDFKAIKEVFQLPDAFEAVLLICIGYFDHTQSLSPRKPRKPFEEIVKII